MTPFDPRSREVLDDPYPVYDEYRSRDPVHRGVPLISGGGETWYLFRYADVRRLLVSDAAHKLPSNGRPAATPPLLARSPLLKHWLVFKDGADHSRVRAELGPEFTPRAVARWAPEIGRICDELLADLPAQGPFDFVRAFGLPLPLRVIGAILGIRDSDRESFEVHSRALLAASFSGRDRGPEAVRTAAEAMEALAVFVELVLARHGLGGPEDGLVPALLHAERHGRISHAEVVANCIHLLNAGYETTVHLLSKGVLGLLAEGWPGEADEAAVAEELARWDGPVQMVTRFTHAPVPVEGFVIPAGVTVGALLGAANRDPVVFPDPDRLRPGRPVSHLAFGGGPHYCLGATLARLETTVALSRLRSWLPRWQRDAARPVVRNASLVFHGLETLPLRVTG